MARLEALVEQITDQALRREIESALAASKRRQRFGLVFEEHIPETAALGLPVQVGALVQRRDQFAAKAVYRVSALDGGMATIVPTAGGDAETVPATVLLSVKRFGEPIYPALTPLGAVRRGDDRTPHHAVINGENFHALQLLGYLLEGQVDCIYIDPPYNTGARDWKYNNQYVDLNDTWRHSKWLSMMDKRLRLAKRLLRPDGILVVTIDKNEHAHLVCLLEDIFRTHEITSVGIVHNPRGVQGDNFSYTNEFAVFVIPDGLKAIAQRQLTESEKRANTSNLRNWGGESLRTDARNCFYPIYVRAGEIVGFGDVAPDDVHPAGANEPGADSTIAVWPIDAEGVERKWRYARQSVEGIRHLLVIKEGRGRCGRPGVLQIEIAKEEGIYRTVWQDRLYDASTHGTQIVRAFTGQEFPFPKSLYAVYEVLYACTAHRPHALILDFFAGSGTTLHAALLLNAVDNGARRCILVTNNEVDDKTARELNRAGLFQGDPDYERHGIFEEIM